MIRMALVCSDELMHSVIIDRLTDHFRGDEGFDLKIMARSNLLHTELKNEDLYFVMGGDGTLFTLTHYLKEGYIVGIQASNDKSIGHFMGLCPDREKMCEKGWLGERMKELAQGLFSDDPAVKSSFVRYNRLTARIRKATGITIPVDLAFNEYAIGNNLFGRPSKYTLFINSSDAPKDGEWQRSSGVISSTYHGMSGWPRHIFNSVGCRNGDGRSFYEKIMDEYRRKTEAGREFFYIVRESMHEIQFRRGFTHKLILISDMVGGVISLDGFNEYPFERNDRVDIEMSDLPLYLYTKRKVSSEN